MSYDATHLVPTAESLILILDWRRSIALKTLALAKPKSAKTAEKIPMSKATNRGQSYSMSMCLLTFKPAFLNCLYACFVINPHEIIVDPCFTLFTSF